LLRLVARCGVWRRSTLRFAEESARIESWLTEIRQLASMHYDLACEAAACHRLVKGYGATHEQGLKNFARVMAAVSATGITDDIADRLRGWRAAALADDDGMALDKALEVGLC
jgi:indolepyruvate ferredoxin oxidoreductase beta subunit